MGNLSNIGAVTRREYGVRVRTRSFVAGTILLVVSVVAIALVPVLITFLGRSGAERIEVWVGAPDFPGDPAATLAALLNATPGGTTGASSASSGGAGTFLVETVTDLAAARTAVDRGTDAGALGIERAGTGELRFTFYTNDASTGRTAQLVQQAAGALAIADRLARAGVAPSAQAGIFAPADFNVAWADPNRIGGTQTSQDQGTSYLLGFGMSILIFMMIVLYGQWTATSVVEEKSSRVMEVILNAATPFQLLAGKVLGIAAVALTQYGFLVAAGILAILLQGPLASLVLGSAAAGVTLPQGLTPLLLALLLVYGVLGFLLYAVLYAAAGSIVSRQEEVNQAVAPMTLISTAGYMVAVYSSTGLLDNRAGWLAVVAQVPFFSPFLMLSRVANGQTSPGEVGVSLVLLVVAIVAAIWVSARIYRAGVLMYGQRPGLRSLWRLFRAGT